MRFFADTAFWLALSSHRDQYHRQAQAWQRHVERSEALLITTEAVGWEWLNGMCGPDTCGPVAAAYKQIWVDPLIEVVPFSVDMNAAALRLFTERTDKEWSLTDCLSFIVMESRNIQEALTADHHFRQAGFRPVLRDSPPIM